jgi:acetaldehyde dehydrogenase/alcohol dehydrogenase
MQAAAAAAAGNILPTVAGGKFREPVADEAMARLRDTLERSRAAQRAYSHFSQEQVDAIFRAAALAANQARIPLAKMAVQETRMGVVEDKVRVVCAV